MKTWNILRDIYAIYHTTVAIANIFETWNILRDIYTVYHTTLENKTEYKAQINKAIIFRAALAR